MLLTILYYASHSQHFIFIQILLTKQIMKGEKNDSAIFCLQGVSAVEAFFELLSQSSLNVLHPGENKPVAPVELCPILKTLYKVLISRYFPLTISLNLGCLTRHSLLQGVFQLKILTIYKTRIRYEYKIQ